MTRMLGLARDDPEHRLVEAERRDDELVPLRRRAVTGEQVEERRRIGAVRLLRREEPDVGVAADRSRVVVARREVHVTAEAAALASDDEQALRVRLQAEEAVDDVDARLLERARPDDVRLLVEA